jgi:hypothetical protein
MRRNLVVVGPLPSIAVRRVFDTPQRGRCRVSAYAECRTLGKRCRCRDCFIVECGTRQIILCRVPDKKHSTKRRALSKGLDYGSEGVSSVFRKIFVPIICISFIQGHIDMLRTSLGGRKPEGIGWAKFFFLLKIE